MRILKSALWTSAALIGLAVIVAAPASADIQHLDDVIISGSLCVGFDCVNGESFGFDTIRVKENNVRIKFLDTSSTASFPSNDWQLTANETTNGGANKFSIDDISGGRTPFTIEAGAPTHSLFVTNGGRLGLGTSTPVVDVHIKTGNTPTLRLEQDGSSGFTPQTWDVAGNEANFFIRDATSGSTLPFRIYPGAPTSALNIEGSTGDIGVGTTSPLAPLHIRRTNKTAKLEIEDAQTTDGILNTIETTNQGNTTWAIRSSQGSSDGDFVINWSNTVDRMNFTSTSGSGNTFQFDFTPGHLTIGGDFITDANTYPDYVFEDDYELMPLAELASFVERERHLPNVPSQADVDADGGKIRLNELQIALLEKVEELTLYTIDQHQTIEALTARLEALEAPQSE